ncbi:CLUMA_CG007972, isoform A [Clunio marinus]|uniref:CLUMA_CG007972, isoform A n=1 Tax=Clunio marinus TaxID=568069 RepID=A0A1J1I7T8_9DIPT|nr:CLUMA_CG007972, isoform A [Clunio marinus]
MTKFPFLMWFSLIFQCQCLPTNFLTKQSSNIRDEKFKLILLHNNDMHARFEETGLSSDRCKKAEHNKHLCFGGFARVASKVKEYRSLSMDGKIPNVLFLNAGDTYTGSTWFSTYKDVISADFLNILKPDVMSLGNHEFDEGTENLSQFLQKLKFPVVAANVITSMDSNMFPGLFQPSQVIEIEKYKIGVIGYVTPKTKQISPLNNISFIDEISAINDEAVRLKSKDVNIIIALGHSGIDMDKKIAAQCEHVDVVVGGHSDDRFYKTLIHSAHTFLYTGAAPSKEIPEGPYPTVVINEITGRQVPVVQAYAFTKYLGYLELEFDGFGNLIEFNGSPILLDENVEQDSEVLNLLDVYRQGIKEFEVIGRTEVFLDGKCRIKECNLGNFITDGFVDWFSSESSIDHDDVVAILGSGAIRSSIDHEPNAGIIDEGDIELTMPFNDNLTLLEVTGEDLLQAFENSVHRFLEFDKPGEFLQVSGIQVTYNLNNPSGQRVASLKVRCKSCQNFDFHEVDLKKSYEILTSYFIGKGSDGFEMFKGKIKKIFTKTYRDSLIDFLRKKSPIAPVIEGRIKFIR